ncbi:MAG: sulfite exporter TauE/SafE family protein [Dehalococcoidia bacterium]
MDAADIGWVALFTALAAWCQAVTGFGFSLLVVPPLSIAIGPRQAVVVANLLSTFLGMLTAGRLHHTVDWQLGGRLLAGAVVGMPVGVAVLLTVEPGLLKLVIAATVLASTVILWRGWRIRRSSQAGDLAAGFLSGVLNTSTSMSGPPVVVYLQGRGVEAARFRATLAAYFLASSAIAVAMLTAGGEVRLSSLGLAAVGAATVFPAWAAGMRVARHVPEQLFRRLVLATLVLSAIAATVSTLT